MPLRFGQVHSAMPLGFGQVHSASMIRPAQVHSARMILIRQFIRHATRIRPSSLGQYDSASSSVLGQDDSDSAVHSAMPLGFGQVHSVEVHSAMPLGFGQVHSAIPLGFGQVHSGEVHSARMIRPAQAYSARMILIRQFIRPCHSDSTKFTRPKFTRPG